ncbi:AAA-like domain-containing protein [Cylindrospermopsis raciborskii DSH]
MLTPPYVLNPYIIGRPISDQELLFGREEIFSWIKGNLTQGHSLLLLHGQRRIGKSSIMHNIPKQLGETEGFKFVSLDLEQFYSSANQSWGSILGILAQEILNALDLNNIITPPTSAKLELQPDIFTNHFLPTLHQNLPDQKLVVLLDEFDALIGEDSEFSSTSTKAIFDGLLNITHGDNKLCLILCFGEHLATTLNIINRFSHIPIIKISLLDKKSTKQLITGPVKNNLEYGEEAIQKIFDISAGHPYIIQIICYAIFSRVRENDSFNVKVTSADVETSLNQAMEIGEGGLSWFWYGFSVSQKVVLSAIAQSKSTGINYLELLASHGINRENSWIQLARSQLLEEGFLDDQENIKIELVRRWIAKSFPLVDQITPFQEFEQKKSPADDQSGNANMSIGEVLSSKNILLFPNSSIIESPSFHRAVLRRYPFHQLLYRSNLFMVTMIGTCSLIFLSIAVLGIYRLSNPCTPNEKKALGILCLEGSKTKSIINSNGNDPKVSIEQNNDSAEKQGNPLALAVVLPSSENISNNNVTGNVLNGVAKAQDEFNKKQKQKNSRLVKILVEYSQQSDAPKKAKELVNNPSILGVIHYYSPYSADTNDLISVYEKGGVPFIFLSTQDMKPQGSILNTNISPDSANKLAEYVYKNLKLKSAAIFANTGTNYTKAMAEAFKTSFENLGGKVDKVIDLGVGDKEFDAQEKVNELKSPVAILFPDRENSQKAVDIANAKYKSSSEKVRKLKLLGGDTVYGTNILMGKPVEGMVLSIRQFNNRVTNNATQVLINSLGSNPNRESVLKNMQRQQKTILVKIQNSEFVILNPKP